MTTRQFLSINYKEGTIGDARFVGRAEQLERSETILEHWRAGQSSMIAVTGPRGCGITSFLQQLPAHLSNNETLRHTSLTRRPGDIDDSLAQLCSIVGCTQPVSSTEELLEFLNNAPPSVFVIDNGHFLACRIMGVLSAIHIFGAIIVATQQRHLWIMGCHEYAWRRLVYTYQVDRYFSTVVELPFFSEAELGMCLLSRIQASGITLASEMAIDNPQLPVSLQRQLTALHKLSNGKPDLAFFYLLNALQVEEKSGLVDLQPAIGMDFGILKTLINEELFTLAEITVHGELTIKDHSAIFRCSQQESWLLLERLYHYCLLNKNETGDEAVYKLLPMYAGLITRHLAHANYLY